MAEYRIKLGYNYYLANQKYDNKTKKYTFDQIKLKKYYTKSATLTGKNDRIVIDTAPTGHTLRMLSYPEFLDEFFEKIIKIRGRFVPGIQPIFHRFSMNCTIVTAAS